MRFIMYPKTFGKGELMRKMLELSLARVAARARCDEAEEAWFRAMEEPDTCSPKWRHRAFCKQAKLELAITALRHADYAYYQYLLKKKGYDND